MTAPVDRGELPVNPRHPGRRPNGTMLPGNKQQPKRSTEGCVPHRRAGARAHIRGSTLVEAMRVAPWPVRVHAAEFLLDRGFGKPLQANMVVQDNNQSLEDMTDAELMAIIRAVQDLREEMSTHLKERVGDTQEPPQVIELTTEKHEAFPLRLGIPGKSV